MRREEWTPSRHQYLCSDHFTEDCFDIRWGIRYLKNTAVPTIFPADDHDDEKRFSTSRRSPMVKPSTSETDPELREFESPPSKRPLILRKACKTVQPNAGNTVAEHSEVTFELPLVADASITCQSNLPEIKTTEITSDTEMPTASCLALSPLSESHSEEQADSTMAVLCCEAPGPFPSQEEYMGTAALKAAMSHTIHFVPVETVKEKPSNIFFQENRPSEGEHISVYEHSYCRPDTDRDQLWNKILCLHAKILELDRREESTVAKIHALENEIALLRKDGAVFKEKQKILEDYISTLLL